jgi:hypothetical protein
VVVVRKEKHSHRRSHREKHRHCQSQHLDIYTLCEENYSQEKHTPLIKKTICVCCMDEDEASMHTQIFGEGNNSEVY